MLDSQREGDAAADGNGGGDNNAKTLSGRDPVGGGVIPLHGPSECKSQAKDNIPGNPNKSNIDGGGGGGSLLQQIWNSLNPAVCLSPCVTPKLFGDFDDDDNDLVDFGDIRRGKVVDYKALVVPLLRDLKSPGPERTEALQKLFKLTDKDSQEHRVPVVCSDEWDTIEALLPCLEVDPDSSDPHANSAAAAPTITATIAPDRRQTLLLLNNLCIPKENKKHILLGPVRDSLLTTLLCFFQHGQRTRDSHIAAACLYNLSFWDEAKTMLLLYVPPPSSVVPLLSSSSCSSSNSGTSPPPSSTAVVTPTKDDSVESPIDNPRGLLRLLESLVADFLLVLSVDDRANRNRPIAAVTTTNNKQASAATLTTMEAATVRWCMALMRNFATMSAHAAILANRTQFPRFAASIVRDSRRDLAHWSRDSVEDSSLLLLLLLVQSGPESCRFMDDNISELRTMCQQVSLYPGIHGVRAGVILQSLDDAQQERRYRKWDKPSKPRFTIQDSNGNNNLREQDRVVDEGDDRRTMASMASF